VPSVLAAIWGIDGYRNALILCPISIGLLLIWRYFAHYIDNDIAKIYIDIVKTENQLEVPPYLSLFNNLVDTLTNNKKCSKNSPQIDSLNQEIKQLCLDQKVRFFECLYENQKMGCRGHDRWDKVALIIITICSIGFILSIRYFEVSIIQFFLFPQFFFILCSLSSLVIMILILCIVIVFTSNNIQKNPTEEEIKSALFNTRFPFITIFNNS
jgi:hypothetical protein